MSDLTAGKTKSLALLSQVHSLGLGSSMRLQMCTMEYVTLDIGAYMTNHHLVCLLVHVDFAWRVRLVYVPLLHWRVFANCDQTFPSGTWAYLAMRP